MSFKESPAHSFAFTLPVGRLVARNAPFTLGRRPHHSLHCPVFQAHEISGTKNAGIAKTAAYMNPSVSINLPALAHDPKNFSRRRLLQPSSEEAVDYVDAIRAGTIVGDFDLG